MDDLVQLSFVLNRFVLISSEERSIPSLDYFLIFKVFLPLSDSLPHFYFGDNP